jgi:hypothetical protein
VNTINSRLLRCVPRLLLINLWRTLHLPVHGALRGRRLPKHRPLCDTPPRVRVQQGSVPPAAVVFRLLLWRGLRQDRLLSCSHGQPRVRVQARFPVREEYVRRYHYFLSLFTGSKLFSSAASPSPISLLLQI